MPSAEYNSLYVLGPGARILARYDKAHLVPYGEYLPMRPLLSAIGLSRLAPGAGDILAGPGPRTLDLPGFGRMAGQICYEIVFSGEVVDRANRPDFLFNPSNDAWFGAWGPPQHFAQGAAARARGRHSGHPLDADRHLRDRRRPWPDRRAPAPARGRRDRRAGCRCRCRRLCSPASATCSRSPSPFCSSQPRLQSGAKRASGRGT